MVEAMPAVIPERPERGIVGKLMPMRGERARIGVKCRLVRGRQSVLCLLVTRRGEWMLADICVSLVGNAVICETVVFDAVLCGVVYAMRHAMIHTTVHMRHVPGRAAMTKVLGVASKMRCRVAVREVRGGVRREMRRRVPREMRRGHMGRCHVRRGHMWRASAEVRRSATEVRRSTAHMRRPTTAWVSTATAARMSTARAWLGGERGASSDR